jgi:diaminopropionate ammonia-lyase family
MAPQVRRPVYTNPSARSWTSTSKIHTDIVARFHTSLPGFSPTPLVPLDAVAKEIGVKAVYVKYEGNRWGLPSFKVLGASWAINRAIVLACGLPGAVGLEDLGIAAQEQGIRLFAATDGNHGRAVAKMARVLGIGARIWVPRDVEWGARAFIEREGAEVIRLEGGYDGAVITAAHEARVQGGMLVQDTAFEGYEEVPKVSELDGFVRK